MMLPAQPGCLLDLLIVGTECADGMLCCIFPRITENVAHLVPRSASRLVPVIRDQQHLRAITPQKAGQILLDAAGAEDDPCPIIINKIVHIAPPLMQSLSGASVDLRLYYKKIETSGEVSKSFAV